MADFPVPMPTLVAQVDSISGTGINFDANSISLMGNNFQFGRFVMTDYDIIPYSRGIVMSTGQSIRIASFFGSADLNDAIAPTGAADPGDPVLDPLTNLGAKDVLTLQFTFNPQSTPIVMNYVIGTDEYPDSLLDAASNDQFGFFISGLNPVGGNYVNQNMAASTSIFSIFSDTSLFQDVQSGSYQNFNGVSRILSCTLNVLPCTDYVMRIKIGDSDDEVHDSGLFIGSSQFYALPDSIPPVTATITFPASDTLIYENCSGATITIARSGSSSINNPVLVRLFAFGSATNGIDYTLIPDSVLIPAGQASVSLNITALTDNLPDGIETAFIRYSPLCGVFDTLIFSIGDNSPLVVTPGNDTSICGGQVPVTIRASVSGGAQPVTYQWNNGAGTDTTATVNPVQTTTYTLTATDLCGTTAAGSITVSAGQVPSFVVDAPAASYCEGDTVQFGVLQLTNGATVSWTGPNGFTSSTTTLDFQGATQADSGAYIVMATLNGCSSIPDTIQLIINEQPLTPAIVSNSPVCEGNTLTFSTQAQSNYTYTWNGPGGFTASTQNPSVPQVSEAQEGTYLLVVSVGNCSSDTVFSQVVINQAPLSDAGSDLQLLQNETGNLGGPSSPGVTYSWSPATGLSSPTVSDPSVTISSIVGSQQQFTYILTSSVLGGCSSNDTVLVTVKALPVASFIAPAAQCFVGNSFNFAATGTFDPLTATFIWNFGSFANPATSQSQNPQAVRFNQTGTFPITLQVTDNGLQSAVFTSSVTVYEMPVSNFTSDTLYGCSPAVFITENLSEGAQPLEYYWDFGNGRTSIEQAPKIIYSEAGLYSIALTVTNPDGCADTFVIENMLRVERSPNSSFYANPLRMTITDPRTSITDLSGSSGEGFYTLGNGDTLNALDGLYTYPDTGTFRITQYLGNLAGCWDSSSVLIQVDAGYKVYIPLAFTPGTDNINDRFKVYGEDISQFSMEIYDRWGALIYNSYDLENGWDGTVQLSNKVVPVGVYPYKINLKDKYAVNHSFVGTVVVFR